MRARPWIGLLAALGSLVAGSAAWHVTVFDAPATGSLHEAIVVVIYSGSRLVRPLELLEALHIAGAVGLASGLLVGTVQRQAIRNARAAARAEAEAEALQAERERLDHLNDLLRHYVLNAMNVVLGYTEQLAAGFPEEEDRLATIEEQAEMVVMLIEHVRTVTGVVEGPPATAAVDPDEAVADAIEDAGLPASMTVEADGEAPPVRATDLSRGLSLLLGAVAEAVADVGTLTIEARPDAEHVRLVIVGSPVEGRGPQDPAVLEPGGPAASLKFHLATVIIDQYGEVRRLDGADDRLEFEIVLERAEESDG